MPLFTLAVVLAAQGWTGPTRAFRSSATRASLRRMSSPPLPPTGLDVDVYFSLRSPYCYIALDRLLDLRRRYDVNLRLRIVWPIAIRAPDTFSKMGAIGYRLPYQDIDIFRCAQQHGVPFQYPVPDPVKQEVSADGTRYGRILPFEEQTHIQLLTRCAVYAKLRGLGWEFLNEASRLVWNGQKKPWDACDYKFLRASIDAIGLSGDEVFDAVAAAPSVLDAILADNEALQKDNDAGHTGVPLMVFRNEPFFGQDRIEQLVLRLKQYRMRERTA
jgi:2-hydroxychromene-2-carboxylate isomerase